MTTKPAGSTPVSTKQQRSTTKPGVYINHFGHEKKIGKGRLYVAKRLVTNSAVGQVAQFNLTSGAWIF